MSSEVEITSFERRDLYKLSGKKDPNFRYRFINPENIERRLDEGWVFVDGEESKKLKPNKPTMDGLSSSTDSKIKIGGAYLMKIPKKIAEQRDEYFRSFNERAMKKPVEDLKEEVDKINVKYGKGTAKVLEGEEVLEK